MRKFDHKDAIMLGGLLAIIIAITIMIVTSGFKV